jgi:hypothetical protein
MAFQVGPEPFLVGQMATLAWLLPPTKLTLKGKFVPKEIMVDLEYYTRLCFQNTTPIELIRWPIPTLAEIESFTKKIITYVPIRLQNFSQQNSCR